MSDKTVANKEIELMIERIEGFEQLNWLIARFDYDVEHALDTMVKHNQDMTFLIDYCKEKELI